MTTTPAETGNALPLEAFLPAEPGKYQCVELHGTHAVVLGRDRDGDIELAAERAVITRPASTPVAELPLSATVAALTSAVTAAHGRCAIAASALSRADDNRISLLARVRSYVIDRHEDRYICRNGLDEFLTEFDLAPYEQRLRISYRITGSYEIEGTDTNAAHRDAERYLRLDLSEIDDLIDETSDFTVSSITVTPLTD